MSGLNHLFLVVRVRVFSIFTYHSTRPNNDKNTPVMAVMTTIPKIAIDQKISFRFLLLFSISRCFCVCFSRSFTISESILPEFSRLFLGIYCCSFLTIEGEELGLLPRAPNLLLVDQTTNKSNSSGDNFRKVSNAAPSNWSIIF